MSGILDRFGLSDDAIINGATVAAVVYTRRNRILWQKAAPPQIKYDI
jgi:hypothetical protein